MKHLNNLISITNLVNMMEETYINIFFLFWCVAGALLQILTSKSWKNKDLASWAQALFFGFMVGVIVLFLGWMEGETRHEVLGLTGIAIGFFSDRLIGKVIIYLELYVPTQLQGGGPTGSAPEIYPFSSSADGIGTSVSEPDPDASNLSDALASEDKPGQETPGEPTNAKPADAADSEKPPT